MQVVSHEALKSLAAHQSAACVSIYLPTHRANPEAKQDPIRLKNLLGEAEKRLAAAGLRTPDVRQLVSPAEALLPQHNFAQPGSEGLAVFLAPDLYHHFWLPFAVEERLHVGRRFVVKPLLPSLAPDGLFYVLALSHNQVRLLQATRHSVQAVDLDGVPQSVDEALPFDEHEAQLQFHTGTRSPGGQGGDRPGVYFGTGTTGDEHNTDLLRFFNQVDAGVRAKLGPSTAPLILAGVEYLHPLYQSANEYPHLLPDGLTGNADLARPEALHAQAWGIVRPIITAGREAAAEQFRRLNGAGDPLASTNLDVIVPAAHYGRVESLFVTLAEQAWGRFDRDANAVTRLEAEEPDADDLYDLAAVQAYLNGAKVYAVTPDKMPNEAPIAAVLRY